MSNQIFFKCAYCDKEHSPTFDTSGDMLTGLLSICDCSESRAAWEAKHRADMERRKNANRGTAVRSQSIVHVGRTPSPVSKRYRSR